MMGHAPKIYQALVRDVEFGSGTKIIEPVNMYECTVGNDSFIGPFVEVQSDVVIGNRVKVQSHSFICSGVKIGDDCFIGHGVAFINDKFSTGGPAGGNKLLWEKTHIGNKVFIGSNATILPVKICDDVVIGAGAVVTKDINQPGTYIGNPARRIEKNGDGL